MPDNFVFLGVALVLSKREAICSRVSRIQTQCFYSVYQQLSRNVSTAYHITVILTRSSRMNARKSIRNTAAVSILLFPTSDV